MEKVKEDKLDVDKYYSTFMVIDNNLYWFSPVTNEVVIIQKVIND
jgi:hypothetical protein